MQRSSRVAVGAALAAAAVLTPLTQPASAAVEPATTQSTHHVEAATGSYYGCAYGDLCVHYYTIGYYGEREYHWARYKECRVHNFQSAGWHATWYVNNQTPGTRGDFWYYDVIHTYDLEFLTEEPPSRGAIPTRYNGTDERYETPYALDVC